jgi:hypothetical protein
MCMFVKEIIKNHKKINKKYEIVFLIEHNSKLMKKY